MTDIPQIVIFYDPTGRAGGALKSVFAEAFRLRMAQLSVASDLEPAAIAGIATQLGLLLLEQLAPPLKDE